MLKVLYNTLWRTLPDCLVRCKLQPRIFQEKATSATSGFHAGLLSWTNWNLKMFVSVETRKLKKPKKNYRSKARTKNSTHMWHRPRIQPGPQ